MNLPSEFIFSQTSLQDYLDCPRRFQLKYLLHQRWPAPEVDDMLAFEERIDKGGRFHHLVEQHLAGIPAETLRAHTRDPEVLTWFEAYLRGGLTDVPSQRRAELTLSAPLGAYRLMAKFDLLALEPGGRALIIDWKTGHQPPRTGWLAERMQTLVYRWVLAEAGDALYGAPVPPEQIEMIYWYADADGAVRRLPYDAAQHAAAGQRLLALVEDIDTRLDFPLTADTRRCAYCSYRSLCGRGVEAGALNAWEDDAETLSDGQVALSLDLDQIGEAEF